MSLVTKSVRLLNTVGLAALAICLCFPASLLGESSVRTISLEATDREHSVNITVGSQVTFLNNYPQELYGTSLIKDSTEKKLLSIESFGSGQTFGLQFSQKGPYSICYSLKPKTDSTELICLQINVVPLQTA